MNRQQKTLLAAACGVLALILVVILVIMLNWSGPDQPAAWPDFPAVTDSPETGTPGLPLSEEEMGRQAMSEEEDEQWKLEGEAELQVD